MSYCSARVGHDRGAPGVGVIREEAVAWSQGVGLGPRRKYVDVLSHLKKREEPVQDWTSRATSASLLWACGQLGPVTAGTLHPVTASDGLVTVCAFHSLRQAWPWSFQSSPESVKPQAVSFYAGQNFFPVALVASFFKKKYIY